MSPLRKGFTIYGSRLTVHGSQFTVYGLRFAVCGLRFAVYGLRFAVWVSLEVRVKRLGVDRRGSGFRVWKLEFRVYVRVRGMAALGVRGFGFDARIRHLSLPSMETETLIPPRSTSPAWPERK